MQHQLAIAISAWLTLAGEANAQSVVMWIRDPLPDELKERAVKLLHNVRPQDVDASLANMKIIDGRLWREDGFLFLRIESSCKADFCMTMIARVTDRAITPELTLSAGKAVLFRDYAFPLWGVDAGSDIVFEGTVGSALAATRRDGVWVVGACGQCRNWGTDGLAEAPEPKTPGKSGATLPMSYEEFRRALNLPP